MAEEPKKSKVPQIVAGSLAVLTSAGIGSIFGVAGTTVGLAFGSLVSGLAAEIYERPLEKAHDTLKSKLTKKKFPEVSSPQDVKITEKSRYGDTRFFTGVLLDQPPKPVRRKFNPKWAILVAIITFVVGLGSVTLIEFAKGSPISGGNSGTTLSGLLGKPTKTVEKSPTSHPEWTTTQDYPTTTAPTFSETTTEPSTTNNSQTSTPSTTNSETTVTTTPQETTSQSVPVTSNNSVLGN